MHACMGRLVGWNIIIPVKCDTENPRMSPSLLCGRRVLARRVMLHCHAATVFTWLTLSLSLRELQGKWALNGCIHAAEACRGSLLVIKIIMRACDEPG